MTRTIYALRPCRALRPTRRPRRPSRLGRHSPRLPHWWAFDGPSPALVLNPGRSLSGARLSYARSARLLAVVARGSAVPNALRARLAPVMREPEPVSEDALVQAKPDGSSPLVRVLRERAGVLRAIACDLDEIIGRLDL